VKGKGRPKIDKSNILKDCNKLNSSNVIEKCMKTQFVTTWTLAIVREVGDKFHQNFQVDL
jgi:hypothetical protein